MATQKEIDLSIKLFDIDHLLHNKMAELDEQMKQTGADSFLIPYTVIGESYTWGKIALDLIKAQYSNSPHINDIDKLVGYLDQIATVYGAAHPKEIEVNNNVYKALLNILNYLSNLIHQSGEDVVKSTGKIAGCEVGTLLPEESKAVTEYCKGVLTEIGHAKVMQGKPDKMEIKGQNVFIKYPQVIKHKLGIHSVEVSPSTSGDTVNVGIEYHDSKTYPDTETRKQGVYERLVKEGLLCSTKPNLVYCNGDIPIDKLNRLATFFSLLLNGDVQHMGKDTTPVIRDKVWDLAGDVAKKYGGEQWKSDEGQVEWAYIYQQWKAEKETLQNKAIYQDLRELFLLRDKHHELEAFYKIDTSGQNMTGGKKVVANAEKAVKILKKNGWNYQNLQSAIKNMQSAIDTKSNLMGSSDGVGHVLHSIISQIIQQKGKYGGCDTSDNTYNMNAGNLTYCEGVLGNTSATLDNEGNSIIHNIGPDTITTFILDENPDGSYNVNVGIPPGTEFNDALRKYLAKEYGFKQQHNAFEANIKNLDQIRGLAILLSNLHGAGASLGECGIKSIEESALKSPAIAEKGIFSFTQPTIMSNKKEWLDYCKSKYGILPPGLTKEEQEIMKLLVDNKYGGCVFASNETVPNKGILVYCEGVRSNPESEQNANFDLNGVVQHYYHGQGDHIASIVIQPLKGNKYQVTVSNFAAMSKGPLIGAIQEKIAENPNWKCVDKACSGTTDELHLRQLAYFLSSLHQTYKFEDDQKKLKKAVDYAAEQAEKAPPDITAHEQMVTVWKKEDWDKLLSGKPVTKTPDKFIEYKTDIINLSTDQLDTLKAEVCKWKQQGSTKAGVFKLFQFHIKMVEWTPLASSTVSGWYDSCPETVAKLHLIDMTEAQLDNIKLAICAMKKNGYSLDAVNEWFSAANPEIEIDAATKGWVSIVYGDCPAPGTKKKVPFDKLMPAQKAAIKAQVEHWKSQGHLLNDIWNNLPGNFTLTEFATTDYPTIESWYHKAPEKVKPAIDPVLLTPWKHPGHIVFNALKEAGIQEYMPECFGKKITEHSNTGFKASALIMSQIPNPVSQYGVSEKDQQKLWKECLDDWYGEEEPKATGAKVIIKGLKKWGDLNEFEKKAIAQSVKKMQDSGYSPVKILDALETLANIDPKTAPPVAHILLEWLEPAEVEPPSEDKLKESQQAAINSFGDVTPDMWEKSHQTKEYKKLPQPVKNYIHALMKYHLLLGEKSYDNLIAYMQYAIITADGIPITPLMVKLQTEIEKKKLICSGELPADAGTTPTCPVEETEEEPEEGGEHPSKAPETPESLMDISELPTHLKGEACSDLYHWAKGDPDYNLPLSMQEKYKVKINANLELWISSITSKWGQTSKEFSELDGVEQEKAKIDAANLVKEIPTQKIAALKDLRCLHNLSLASAKKLFEDIYSKVSSAKTEVEAITNAMPGPLCLEVFWQWKGLVGNYSDIQIAQGLGNKFGWDYDVAGKIASNLMGNYGYTYDMMSGIMKCAVNEAIKVLVASNKNYEEIITALPKEMGIVSDVSLSVAVSDALKQVPGGTPTEISETELPSKEDIKIAVEQSEKEGTPSGIFTFYKPSVVLKKYIIAYLNNSPSKSVSQKALINYFGYGIVGTPLGKSLQDLVTEGKVIVDKGGIQLVEGKPAKVYEELPEADKKAVQELLESLLEDGSFTDEEIAAQLQQTYGFEPSTVFDMLIGNIKNEIAKKKLGPKVLIINPTTYDLLKKYIQTFLEENKNLHYTPSAIVTIFEKDQGLIVPISTVTEILDNFVESGMAGKLLSKGAYQWIYPGAPTLKSPTHKKWDEISLENQEKIYEEFKKLLSQLSMKDSLAALSEEHESLDMSTVPDYYTLKNQFEGGWQDIYGFLPSTYEEMKKFIKSECAEAGGVEDCVIKVSKKYHVFDNPNLYKWVQGAWEEIYYTKKEPVKQIEGDEDLLTAVYLMQQGKEVWGCEPAILNTGVAGLTEPQALYCQGVLNKKGFYTHKLSTKAPIIDHLNDVDMAVDVEGTKDEKLYTLTLELDQIEIDSPNWKARQEAVVEELTDMGFVCQVNQVNHTVCILGNYLVDGKIPEKDYDTIRTTAIFLSNINAISYLEEKCVKPAVIEAMGYAKDINKKAGHDSYKVLPFAGGVETWHQAVCDKIKAEPTLITIHSSEIEKYVKMGWSAQAVAEFLGIGKENLGKVKSFYEEYHPQAAPMPSLYMMPEALLKHLQKKAQAMLKDGKSVEDTIWYISYHYNLDKPSVATMVSNLAAKPLPQVAQALEVLKNLTEGEKIGGCVIKDGLDELQPGTVAYCQGVTAGFGKTPDAQITDSGKKVEHKIDGKLSTVNSNSNGTWTTDIEYNPGSNEQPLLADISAVLADYGLHCMYGDGTVKCQIEGIGAQSMPIADQDKLRKAALFLSMTENIDKLPAVCVPKAVAFAKEHAIGINKTGKPWTVPIHPSTVEEWEKTVCAKM